MKKIMELLTSIILVFTLAACGSTQSNDTVTDAVTNQPGETSEPEKELTEGAEEKPTEGTDTVESIASTDTTESGSKILVVYYSASGNTERVANDIANTLGADVFELVPETAYTEEDLDWTKDGSRVNKEHDDESLSNVPLVQSTVSNWDEYDTVFIGYPIWWGIAAWPVNEFVTGNDFTGKTVIPFATSASSGIGDSGTLLEEMAGTGSWQEGQRFSSGVSTEDVAAWAEKTGL